MIILTKTFKYQQGTRSTAYTKAKIQCLIMACPNQINKSNFQLKKQLEPVLKKSTRITNGSSHTLDKPVSHHRFRCRIHNA